jgi:ferredoxin-nitrate reductase
VNHGRLGPKGLYGWQGQLHDRLTRPMIRNGTTLVEASWDEAMDLITTRSRELLDSKGPLSHGFYTSGQLMLEEYYTLAVIGKAGIGTPHMDGNTRLCTATAAASLKESFGADGQPSSYADLDVCQALFCFGHNVAATQTVLWSRILDRLAGPDSLRLVAVDPRETPVAKAAEVHLAPRPGSNLALVNGLLQQLIANDWIDQHYIEAHTRGFEALASVAGNYPPSRVAEICGVASRDVAICPASATGRTKNMSLRWLSCGMSIRSSSPTGPSRPTRCRSSATSSKGRSISCGSPAPTPRYRCPSSAGSARSWAKRRSSWSSVTAT